MTKRTAKAKIEPYQGTVETACDFSKVYGFVERAPELTLETSTGTEFAVEAAESEGRKVIRLYQGGKEYARAYKRCWGHYYNCHRTRIGMYCPALDAAAKAWFDRKVAELKAELERFPADRREQLRRELEAENGNQADES